MVNVTKFEPDDGMYGPWKIVSRQYFQTAKEVDRMYKVSRPGKNGTEARHFREVDLSPAAPTAAGRE